MILMNILDMLGTAAFAVSGTLVAMRNRLDLFGILVLSILTASGGGLLRDVIIHDGLPVFFTEPKYLAVTVLSTIIACTMLHTHKRLYLIIQVVDAIGLGVFTAMAAYKGILAGMPPIGVVFLAVLTGIGGGVLRDIMVNDVPIVFRSEIYALASMVGAICFYSLFGMIPVNVLLYGCFFLTLAIRILSMVLKLNLPVIQIKDPIKRIDDHTS